MNNIDDLTIAEIAHEHFNGDAKDKLEKYFDDALQTILDGLERTVTATLQGRAQNLERSLLRILDELAQPTIELASNQLFGDGMFGRAASRGLTTLASSAINGDVNYRAAANDFARGFAPAISGAIYDFFGSNNAGSASQGQVSADLGRMLGASTRIR